MFNHGCLLLATVVCSVLGEIVQVSHSSEEVLALKKEIARCQVEADKLRTAISLNKVCSSIQSGKCPSPILLCHRPSTPPPPPPLFSCFPLFSAHPAPIMHCWALGLLHGKLLHPALLPLNLNSMCLFYNMCVQPAQPAHYEKQSEHSSSTVQLR